MGLWVKGEERNTPIDIGVIESALEDNEALQQVLQNYYVTVIKMKVK